jgi:hypothetical protein
MRLNRIVLALALCLATACASTTIANSWKNPAYGSMHPKNLLVVAMMPSPSLRGLVEDQMVAQLQNKQTLATASSRLFPSGAPISKEKLLEASRQYGFDGILVARFVGVHQRTDYVPPTSFDTMWAFGPVGEPGYYQTTEIARVETSLYDSRGNNPIIWSADTETFNPSSANEEVPHFVAVVVNRMEQDLS